MAQPGKSEFAGKHLLIVDDDEAFLSAMALVLERTGFTVTKASKGKLGAQLAILEDFDAVISDINMPDLSGIELLHQVRKIKPVPIILITGFAELRETQEAYELGANGFIAKPFGKEELVRLLREIWPSGPAAAPESLDSEFVKIHLEDFVSGKEIRYHIFIRLSETKYVRIASQGEDISHERIRSYKEKNINYLYLRRDDFQKYVNFNVQLASAVASSPTLGRAKKLAFVMNLNEVILKKLRSDNIDKEAYSMAAVAVETTAMILSEHNAAADMIMALEAQGEKLYAHAVAVSLYSAMIAREAGWNSAQTIFKVTMGSLLHDIGLKEIDPHIVDKARESMTAEELRLFETHPVRGAELLTRVSNIPDDVVQIAYQHHEDCLGFGYPRRLTKTHIHPMAKLVYVADLFCALVFGDHGHQRLSADQAVRRMSAGYLGRMDGGFFDALLRLLRIDKSTLEGDKP